MIAPVIPENEAERLKDLYALELRQSEAEDRFDRMTRLAAKLFDVPMAYISMVDADQPWVKSRVGIGACSSCRDSSFCGHTILQDDVMIISDTHRDRRFSDNPMVTGEPHIRFYAGQPLKGRSGYNIGTLSLLDHRPRELSPDERQLLQDLTRMVEKELHLSDLLEMQQQLIGKQEQVNRQLAEAADYVKSQLPEPLTGQHEPVQADWIYHPSSDLGGDSMCYGWIDDEHFGIFLIDVTGHGISASLLSTSILHFAHSQKLVEMDWDLSIAAGQINRNFQSVQHSGRLFSMWAGVYEKSTRRLRYFNGGHPAPLLKRAASGIVESLDVRDLIFGVNPDYEYQVGESVIEPEDQLLVFSDGIFEIKKEDATIGTYEEFKQLVSHANLDLKSLFLEQEHHDRNPSFEDDVSLLLCRFS
ncbi:MAG: GAF domain-containing SpoIIE family protein phosphatase [Verrucomicrobiota bacterium]